MKKALERHDKGEAVVIPVILRPCHWQDTDLARVQALPKDARPVTQWPDRDQAFFDVTQGIRRAIQALRRKRSALALGDVIADFTVFRDANALWCPEMLALPAGQIPDGLAERRGGTL